MGKIIELKSKKENNDKLKKRIAFKEAIKEMKEQTGIDYMKLFSGDEREKQKYELKKRTESIEYHKEDRFR